MAECSTRTAALKIPTVAREATRGVNEMTKMKRTVLKLMALSLLSSSVGNFWVVFEETVAVVFSLVFAAFCRK